MMQIERTEGVNASGLPGGARNLAQTGELAVGQDKAGHQADPGSEVVLEPYLQQAARIGDVRQDRVEQARELLAAGELDTAEAARRAAESILRFGI